MARSIQTVKGRESLKVRREPHWLQLQRGCHLGYRKMTAAGDGVWVAKYRDAESGRRLGHSLGAFDELPANERFGAAKRAAEEWFAHMGAGGTSAAVTVSAACGAYVQHLRDQRREDAADDAASRFKRWVGCASLGKVVLQKLTHPKVMEWRRSLAKTQTLPHDKKRQGERRPRTDSALNRDMASLRAALNHALRERLVTTDAAWKAALLPVQGAGSRRQIYLEPEQRKALVEAAAPEIRPFISGLARLPLRPGALAGLVAADFDARLSVLFIGNDKSGRARQLQLPRSTAEFFAGQIEGKAASSPIFARADGSAWNKDSWKWPIKEAVEAAGLPDGATAYSLRHSTITDLVARHKLDLMTVAILSDTSVAMIEKHYGHLISDHATRALGKLAL